MTKLHSVYSIIAEQIFWLNLILSYFNRCEDLVLIKMNS